MTSWSPDLESDKFLAVETLLLCTKGLKDAICGIFGGTDTDMVYKTVIGILTPMAYQIFVPVDHVEHLLHLVLHCLLELQKTSQQEVNPFMDIFAIFFYVWTNPMFLVQNTIFFQIISSFCAFFFLFSGIYDASCIKKKNLNR